MPTIDSVGPCGERREQCECAVWIALLAFLGGLAFTLAATQIVIDESDKIEALGSGMAAAPPVASQLLLTTFTEADLAAHKPNQLGETAECGSTRPVWGKPGDPHSDAKKRTSTR